MREELEAIYENITRKSLNIINEDHDKPETPVGAYLKDKSAVKLLSILKEKDHGVYEAVEKAVEKLIEK